MTAHPTPPPTGQAVTERLTRRLHTYVCGDDGETCCWTEEGERCADVDLSDMGAALAAEVAAEVAAAEVRALREFADPEFVFLGALLVEPRFIEGFDAGWRSLQGILVETADRIAEGVQSDG